MNKKGFTLVELVAVMIITSLVMLMLGTANSILVKDKIKVDAMYEGTSTFHYLARTLIEDIKSSNGKFRVTDTSIRVYRSDGSHNDIHFDSEAIYRDGKRICEADSVHFHDSGKAIQFDARFDTMPEMHLVISKPQYDLKS